MRRTTWNETWRRVHKVLFTPLPWFPEPTPAQRGWSVWSSLFLYWRLARLTRGYRQIHGQGFTIAYPPDAWDSLDADLYLSFCKIERAKLLKRFGFRAVTPLRIDLLPRSEIITQLLGHRYHGFADSERRRIALGLNLDVHEATRHELVHIFAARWNQRVPPLLQEGLAVWLQRTSHGRNINAALSWTFAKLARCRYRQGTARTINKAFAQVLDSYVPLSKLLNERFFFSLDHSFYCYLVAGSFTGYLLHRFGWELYRRLYCRAETQAFERQFLKVFGMSLELAEEEWRRGLRKYVPRY